MIRRLFLKALSAAALLPVVTPAQAEHCEPEREPRRCDACNRLMEVVPCKPKKQEKSDDLVLVTGSRTVTIGTSISLYFPDASYLSGMEKEYGEDKLTKELYPELAGRTIRVCPVCVFKVLGVNL